MSDFLIDRCLIGTQKHLLVTSGFSWVAEVPNNVWHLSGKLKSQGFCLDTLFRLENINVDIAPPKNYYQAMQTLMSSSVAWPPPWQDVMPLRIHRKFVEDMVNNVSVALGSIDTNFYNNVWLVGNRVFSSFQRAMINEERRRSYILQSQATSALESFKPDNTGYASQVVYNRFGTRTGRPAIQAGPHILTLKREYRDIITSRWGNDGVIAILDFSALEVRVILHEAGETCDKPDLYEELNHRLYNGKMTRKDIKGAVICDLYGQSKYALSQTLGIRGKHLDAFMDTIRTYFKSSDLTQRVKQQFIKLGYITNRYGRKVTIDEPLDHLLLNSYAQSTGADVVTLGFAQILDRISSLQAHPLFALVDAIIIDCHKNDVEELKKIDAVTVDGYDQKWPLKFDLL